MDSLSFKEIPQENKSTINFIVNETIIKLYSKFDFLYFHEIIADHENEKQDVIQNFIFNYLKNYKFITYQIHENPHINLINAIFCVEGTCLIISEINITILLNLISYLKKEGISILYFRNEFQKIEGFVEDEKFHEEIKSFCSYPKFRSDISKHRFVNDTIGPMIGYMIRRFFYPTSYFKDKTFFIFNNSKSINEGSLKEKITNFLFPKKEEITINLQDFEESDFIILRNEYLKFNATFYLAIHIESFHIFMMKKINNTKEFKHEIYFCQNYSHRCLTHFYGFIKNEGEIKGFIYEYMCNGTLESIVSKNSKIDDESFKLIIINRIFQGIYFLHSKSLIHRDIKPLNILFDHDFLPYVSDFDSICKATDEPDKGEKTKDLGTTDYMSPEQYIGEFISFPTDIFSFGLVIYYIYEKKHMRKISDFYSILKLTKGSDSIKNLCSKCTKLIPLERAKKEEIKTIIFGEAISIIQKQFFSINILNLDQYILDGIAIQIDNKQNISKFLLEIGDMHYFIDDNKYKAIEYYEFSGKLNNSKALYKLGDLYFKGNNVKRDFAKARKYFELSGELKNSEALYKLGDIYYDGLGVTQDYAKSKEYYKMSAQLDNSKALIQVGFFYAYCPGHEKDFVEAKKYFDLAAEKGDSCAYVFLGILYQNGDGVEKDYKKAKEYYDLAAKQKNSAGLTCLGDLFRDGLGVEQDYNKARNYYELSTIFHDSYGYFELGEIYYYGRGVEKDYNKAVNYYEMSAKQGNIKALNKLGNIYYNGENVKKDYKKARDYFKIAAQLNNSDALYYLGDFYYFGYGVQKDYNKAKKYYEKSAQLNNPDALFMLGYLYLKGYGVKQDYNKAKELFELAAKQNETESFFYLGTIYEKGLGTIPNYLKAKEYYEQASKKKDDYALYKLGYFYEKGLGVDQSFLKAKEYYELKGPYYSFSLIKIGTFYQNGHGVKQDYLEAKKYYALSAQLNNSIGFYKIGNLYRKGKGVPKNFERAIYFYELSAKLVNSFAFFYLGVLYSSDDIPKKNITKALFYYLKCSEILDERVKSVNPINNSVIYLERYNKYCYHSVNNIGLIHLINFEDYQKAFIYIIQSAKGKLPFGQNNLGLLNEFYNNDSHKAKYFYKKSAKRNFSLADYNLGHLKEKDGKIDESIEYFTKALEDSALTFRKHQPYDKQLEISKMFIICITNLKLAEYYFKQDLFNESKEYFKNSILKLESFENLTHSFRFTFNFKESMNIFHYIEEYILNFQLFNLPNQPNFKTVMEDIQADLNRRKTKTPKRQIYNKERNDSKSLYKIKKEDNKEDTDAMNKILSNEDNKFEYENQFNSNFESNENLYLEDIGNEMVFEDPADLFDYVIQNKEYKNEFLNEIRDIIKKMNKFLYTYPYQILFGRINTEKPKPKIENTDKYTLEYINQEFYEGLNLNKL